MNEEVIETDVPLTKTTDKCEHCGLVINELGKHVDSEGQVKEDCQK